MQRRVYINGRALGWTERIVAGVLAVLLLILGLAFGTVILGLVVIVGLAFAARIWWVRRQLLRQHSKHQSDVSVIEGEYRVLRRDEEGSSWR